MAPNKHPPRTTRAQKICVKAKFLLFLYCCLSAVFSQAGTSSSGIRRQSASLLTRSRIDFETIFGIPQRSREQTGRITPFVGLYVVENPPGYQASIKAAVDGINFCTWFMIGDRTLLSAAHCLKGGLRTVEIGIFERYKAVCELPAEFGINRSLDLTLCLLDRAYVLPDVDKSRGDGFETVETRTAAIREGKMIRFGGYGCHSPGAGVEKKYALGESRIMKLPPQAHLAGSTEPTPNLIKIRQAPSFLCDGDSGGPAYLFNDDAKTRSVFGVNSATATSIESGYVTSLLTADSRTFLSAWSQKHGQRICGMNAGAANCRAAP